VGNRFREETDLDVSSDTKAKARLLEAAEITNLELYTST